METLGKRIKRMREEQQLSQREIDHKVGISKEYLSRLEHDKASPTIGMLEKLAHALNCQVRDFLGEEESQALEGGVGLTVKVSPGVMGIDTYSEEEYEYCSKLLLILRSHEESGIKAISGLLDTIIDLLEKKAAKKKGRKVA